MARAATIEPIVRMVALAFGLGASVALTVQQATPTALGHKLKAGNEMVDARLQKTFSQVRSLALTHQLRNLRQKALDRRCRRCFENQPRMGWPELRPRHRLMLAGRNRFQEQRTAKILTSQERRLDYKHTPRASSGWGCTVCEAYTYVVPVTKGLGWVRQMASTCIDKRVHVAHFDNEHTAVGRPSASPVSDVSFVDQSWHALAMLMETLSIPSVTLGTESGVCHTWVRRAHTHTRRHTHTHTHVRNTITRTRNTSNKQLAASC